jgi:hypothetical protein
MSGHGHDQWDTRHAPPQVSSQILSSHSTAPATQMEASPMIASYRKGMDWHVMARQHKTSHMRYKNNDICKQFQDQTYYEQQL